MFKLQRVKGDPTAIDRFDRRPFRFALKTVFADCAQPAGKRAEFLEGIGNTKYAMQITIISNVVNIVGNYLFIFGIWIFPEMGLIGAGIGTLIARAIMPFLWFVYLKNLPKYRNYFMQWPGSRVSEGAI